MDIIDPHLVVDRRPKTGANSSRLRDHNERSILSHLREHGPGSGGEIAKALNLSSQTVSVIIRQLDEQGVIRRLDPVKGKVGKPQTPVALAPGGAFSYGLRIGRRTANLILMDILGEIVSQRSIRYPYPTPIMVEEFVEGALDQLSREIADAAQKRIVGIGVAAPFELWNWLDGLGAPKRDADKWRDYAIGECYRNLTDLPTYVANDVNLACMAELMFGRGTEFRDFAYFYVGYFVGGAVVLDGKVFHGPRGNAGAFGSIPVVANGIEDAQLISTSSIFVLERKLAAKCGRPVNLRAENGHWTDEEDLREAWMDGAANSMARAAVAVAAVLDISDIVVDGVFPPPIRNEFVKKLNGAASRIDQQGIHPVMFHEGQLGPDAGQRGAAYQPIVSELLIEGSQLT
ncbi:MAG: ROK family protein [Rhodobacteraceae bacterium]|nr:ROK family protein [Paracoccaceae bacterium]